MIMTTFIPENTAPPATSVSGMKPRVKKKPRVAPGRARDAPAKPKSPRKATAAKKAPKGRPEPLAAKVRVARDGSKSAKMLDLLKRPGGATSKDLMKATGWLPHSVRGLLSGTVGQKMGLTLISTKGNDGERTYSVV